LDPAGVPTKYIRHPRNPTRFFLYPRPVSGTQLLAEYVVTPSKFLINQPITMLPDAYFGALVDGTVMLVSSIDDEHVNSGRAKLFQDMFLQALGVSLQNRALTDFDDGAVGAPQENTR
jgi:hypothetical protein